MDVARLRWQWARESDPGIGLWSHDHGFIASVEQWASQAHRTVWTAGFAGHAVGMVCMTEHSRMPSPRAAAAGRWGYLGHLYVDPGHRGHGIATTLVEHVLHAADRRGYSKVILSPTERSIAVYERCGFSRRNDLMIRRRA